MKNLSCLVGIRCILGLVLMCTCTFQFATAQDQAPPSLTNQQIDGYKGIWFTLGQFFDYGDKYSGGLGTYTAKHKPLAIYAAAVNKTFFVYGGTTHKNKHHLLCMIGSFDHNTKQVSKPRIVYDKMGVDDPHDDPSLSIDPQGHLWVFVSGRGRSRPGFKYRSKLPYSTADFEQISEEEMTYPQIWWVKDQGFFHFFTKYTGVRELYFEHSVDGKEWSADQKLAAIKNKPAEKSGHYQVSGVWKDKVATFFTRHPNGNVDQRTNLYYLQSTDFGANWTTAKLSAVDLPVTAVKASSLVKDYGSLGKNVYLKDMAFDADGNPVCLYLTSGGHEPGPANNPRDWTISHWQDGEWRTTLITQSDHNYDMGSLWIAGNEWTVIAPTQDGPQLHGGGGEIEKWISKDNGQTWTKAQDITQTSKRNHNYVRKVIQGQDDFLYFWADGNPDKDSKSQLYFGDKNGQVWRLPFRMKKDWAKPKRVK